MASDKRIDSIFWSTRFIVVRVVRHFFLQAITRTNSIKIKEIGDITNVLGRLF
jgi:hypothetical protein